MKPGGKGVWVLLGCTLAAAVAASAWRSEKEPEYQGRTLSAWLKAYRQPVGATVPVVSQEAAEAVRHIGSNGLPFLVKWLEQARPMPHWREKLFYEVSSWQLGTSTKQELLEVLDGPQLRAARASWGFIILKDEARPAIPGLLRIVNRGHEEPGVAAIAALRWVGPDALPALLSVVTNHVRSERLRESAARSIVALGLRTNGSWAVPSLARYSAEDRVAAGVARALGSLGGTAVPWLTNALQASRWVVRYEAARALGRLGPEAEAATPALRSALADAQEAVRQQVTNALQQIAARGAEKQSRHPRNASHHGPNPSLPAVAHKLGPRLVKGSKRRLPDGGYEALRTL